MPIYEVFIDGKPRTIDLTKTGESSFNVRMNYKNLNIDLPSDKLDLKKRFSIEINGKAYQIELPKIDREKAFSVKVEEVAFKAEVKIPTRRLAFATFEPARVTPMKMVMAQKQVVEGAVTAPMTGKIISVKVKKGGQVKSGEVLCILEAMKMENEITAPKTGTVREVYISESSPVSEGEVLFVVD